MCTTDQIYSIILQNKTGPGPYLYVQEMKKQSGPQSVQWNYSNLSPSECKDVAEEEEEHTSSNYFTDWTYFMQCRFYGVHTF